MNELAGIFIAAALGVSPGVPRVERWGCHEVVLKGPETGNPFVDTRLEGRFECGSQKISVPGFYDGNGEYRIRFMPPTEGTWRFATRSNRAELDGKKGEVEATRPQGGNHGPVATSGPHRFAYADGTPYHPFGTTCYAWVHQGEATERQTLATLRKGPFNKIRMCVFPKWYEHNRDEPPLYPYEGKPPAGWDFTRFNAAFFRHVEERIRDLGKLGIEADLILFHPYDEGHWGFDRMPAAADNLFARYCVARFSAYRNVWWSMANEYDFVKGKKLSDWKRLIRVVREADPHGHLLSIHNGTHVYSDKDPAITHASIQNGSAVADFGRSILTRDALGMAVIYDEVKYEGDLDKRWGQLSGEEMTHRFWQGVIGGAYVTHGECFKGDDRRIWWSRGGELRGTSPARIGFLRAVVEQGPAGGLEPLDKWQEEPACGRHGEYYLVYFGKNRQEKWSLRLPGKVPVPGKYKAEVLDTWNMTETPVGGEFGLARQGAYHLVAEPKQTIALGGKPWMAVRIRRVDAEGARP